MSTIALPTIALQPADLISSLRFTLEADGQGVYRFRHVRLRAQGDVQAVEAWMTALLEGHSVSEALAELDPVGGNPAPVSMREFLHNLERLLPATAGRLSRRQDDSLAATETCHNCAKHRMAALRRKNGGPNTGADQCECLREYKLRNAQREAVSLTLHKIAG